MPAPPRPSPGSLRAQGGAAAVQGKPGQSASLQNRKAVSGFRQTEGSLQVSPAFTRAGGRQTLVFGCVASRVEGGAVGGRRRGVPSGEGLPTARRARGCGVNRGGKDLFQEPGFKGENLGDSKQKMSQSRPLPLRCLNLLDFLIFRSLYASHTDTQRRLGREAGGKKTHSGRE